MSSSLPFDILQGIVQALSAPKTIDRATLFKLSMTCRSLLPVCRKHIFSAISLQPRSFDVDDPAKKPQVPNQNQLRISITNMELLTTSSPSIIDWVRSLHLEISIANVHDAGLVHLLDKVHFLEKFLLSNLPSPPDGPLLWTKFPNTLQVALSRVIKLKSVSYLTLSNLGIIPLSLILPLSNVTHLGVFSSGFSLSSPNHEWGLNTAPASLKSFCIQRGFSSVLPLLETRYPNGSPAVDLSDLTLFSLEPESDLEEHAAATFLEKLTSLQTLDMSSPGAGRGYLSIPNILKRIHPQSAETLKVLWFQTNFGNIYPLSDIESLPTTVLKSMPKMGSILKIAITINVISPAKEEVLIKDFSELDTLLASPQYASLQVVYIFLYFIGPTPLSRAELNAIPFVHMKRLSHNPSVELIYQANK
ncbi:hypothetical protein M413DRAFT_25530 [Hebeloma cylindrosporum]|uniref:F-box domain-containing protein n=1 Tax=Hebeloma cylindrosporum TaxID=76867 RepID=A0A0C3CIQ5_HEBCY|nr:hypothetical protein M413DRAFT_25530 [Hebeloma cylindrosporum h7]